MGLKGNGKAPLIAYRLQKDIPPIVPGPPDRAWMNETDQRFANRCLPLRLANQFGWMILNVGEVEVFWNGGQCPEDLTIKASYNSSEHQGEVASVVSHFGHGIATWKIPLLFRTPRGISLHVRGPSNWCKDGICPLEGLVETDWAASTFTMNWKVTRPCFPIVFSDREPICMLTPIARDYLENFSPSIIPIEDDPITMQEHLAWAETRAAHLASHLPSHPAGIKANYAAGQSPSTGTYDQHQTTIHLQPFIASHNK